MNKKWIAIILAIVIVVVGGIGGVVLLTGKSSGDALDGTPVTPASTRGIPTASGSTTTTGSTSTW